MIRRQAFKYELRPDGEQKQLMLRFSGSCRFVFNKALALQKQNYDQGGKKLTYTALCKELTNWKNQPETNWLSLTPAQSLQQSLKNLEAAYRNFFTKKADFPRFKKKGNSDSFRYPQGIRLDQSNNRIFLPKLGWMRYRNSREALGLIKNVTISQSGKKWFISIQTQREVEQPILDQKDNSNNKAVIGIDMGIARFATLSDGTFLAPLNSFKKQQQRLIKAQRSLSRKKKRSNNWQKVKTKLQTIHTHIKNCRNDFLHKASTTISKNHALVCMEELQIGNMSKSAAGTLASPGRNVKAKSGLNRSILDQGWGEFKRQLEYKLSWNGGSLIAVNPRNTSRTCPSCNHIAKENRLSQAKFHCVKCSFEENADLVGAINILRAGHAQLACTDTSPALGASGQEPTEAICLAA